MILQMVYSAGSLHILNCGTRSGASHVKRQSLTRRDFLKLAGVTSTGLALSACGVDLTHVPASTETPIVKPLPAATTGPRPTPTPSLLNSPTLGELGRRLGFDVGISLRMVDEFSSLNYQNFLLNFAALTDGWASNPSRIEDTQDTWGNRESTIKYWNTLSAFCKAHHMSLDLNHLYYGWGYFQEDSPAYHLNTASKEEIDTWYQNRVKMFFQIPYFTSANFVNEVTYNDPRTLKYGWGGTKYDPLNRVYGRDYPYVSYKVAWNEALQTGREVGKDIHLVYNTPSSDVRSPGAEYEYSYLLGLRDKLTKEFGLARPFDIGMQFHIGPGPIQSGECWRWHPKYFEKADLTGRFKRLGEIGDIRITEFSIADIQDQQEQKDILHTVVEAFIDSGVGRSFIMWSPKDQYDTHTSRVANLSCSMRNLMDVSYRPLFMYEELYRILESKL